MKEENLDKLNSLFFNLKTEDEKNKENAAYNKGSEDLFLENFKVLCKNFIDPKMQEFKRMLRKNGYGCKISWTDENTYGKGINSQSNIKLQISKNIDSHFYSNNKFPHVMFVAEKNYQRIGIHQDTIFENKAGNEMMKDKKYTLEDLDEESIEREILESIEKILLTK